MLSCLTCVPVVEKKEAVDDTVNTQGTKKKVLMSATGATVVQEECETKGEGSVYLKTKSTVAPWKMIKISVEDTHLLVYRKKNAEPTKVLPLELCNVRPISKRRFRIFCAPNMHFEFRALDHAALREWVNLIQTGIARRLGAQTESKMGSPGKSSGAALLEALRKAHKSNKHCADCNAADPTWISVSIGCIVCIECSGVHRQLGSTISKVRSFELDMWTNRTEMIEKIGNADVNSIYEANILPGHHKPHAFSSREDREKYIYNKYVGKLYRRKTVSLPNGLTVRNSNAGSLSSSDTVVLRKRALNNAMANKEPNHKRNLSKPTIHIGSDPFAVQDSVKVDNVLRRGSMMILEPLRRGSLNSAYVPKNPVNKRTAMLDQRRHSLLPTLDNNLGNRRL